MPVMRGHNESGGARLHKDIVNINENYIHYIQSNPKLVRNVDEIAVAYTGTTGHYLALDLLCYNKQLDVHPLSIRCPSACQTGK